jgi:formyltetrahydrofolate deformylase
MTSEVGSLILRLSCPDAMGIVGEVGRFLASRSCNITESGQFTDRDGQFFMRVGFTPCGGESEQSLREGFASVASQYSMRWDIHDLSKPMRVMLMVSRFGHCLNDLLFRHANEMLPIKVVAVVSNHMDFEALTRHYNIPYHHLPVTAASKRAQETRLMELVEEYDVQLVVLARYMQVLSDDLCRSLTGRAINIHHSFLPSFKGAKPYHQAYERGVKLIGATAHYVTADLDEGPIIEQDVQRAEHFHSPNELVAMGRDVECAVLARAVRLHAERRVMLSGSRTVIFR